MTPSKADESGIAEGFGLIAKRLDRLAKTPDAAHPDPAEARKREEALRRQSEMSERLRGTSARYFSEDKRVNKPDPADVLARKAAVDSSAWREEIAKALPKVEFP